MSELDDLAKRINESSEKDRNLSDADINRLAERLEKIKAAGGTNAVEATVTAAIKESVAGIKSVMPDFSTITNAFIRSNPLIMSAAELFRRSTSAIGRQTELLTSNNEQTIQSLEQKLSEMALNTEEVLAQDKAYIQTLQNQLDNFETGVDKTTDTYDRLSLIIPDIQKLYGDAEASRFLLEEIVEQLKYSNELDENIIDEDRRNKLRSLGVDDEMLDNPNLLEDTNELLANMFDTQQDELRVATLDFFTNTRGTLGILGGLFGSGGLLATGGRFMSGLLRVVKVGGRFAGPVGLIASGLYELYDSFTNAEEELGRTLSLPEKIQYSINSLATMLLEPVDWAIEYFTGTESNLRDTMRTNITRQQDVLFGFVKKFAAIPIALVSSLFDITTTLFDGITMDTMLQDMPQIMLDNLNGSLQRSFDRISESFDRTIENGMNVLSSIGDYIQQLFDGLKNRFNEAFNSSLDYISSGLEENLGFGIGSAVADQLRELKVEPTERLESVTKPLPPSEPLIYREPRQPESTVTDPKLLEALKELKEEMSKKGDTNVVTSAPVTSNSSTTVLKSGMSVYSGLRNLRPES